MLISPLKKWIDIIAGGKWLLPSDKSPNTHIRKKSLYEQYRFVLKNAGLLIPEYETEYEAKIQGKKVTRTIETIVANVRQLYKQWLPKLEDASIRVARPVCTQCIGELIPIEEHSKRDGAQAAYKRMSKIFRKRSKKQIVTKCRDQKHSIFYDPDNDIEVYRFGHKFIPVEVLDGYGEQVSQIVDACIGNTAAELAKVGNDIRRAIEPYKQRNH